MPRRVQTDPMFLALEIVGNKWAAPILWFLNREAGPIRFRELQRRIGSVTQKELTRRLRELERMGLVSREVFASVPPRVEYRLTDLGASMIRPLSELACWAEKNLKQLCAARASFDAANVRKPPKKRTMPADDDVVIPFVPGSARMRR